MKTLEINERFAQHFDELDYGQEQQLEKSLRSDPTSEPILFWHNPEKNRDEILDGHHRYGIAKKFNIELQTHEKFFDSEDAAMLFIVRHQTTRRNLSNREHYVRLAVELEIKLGKSKTQAVKEIAADMGLAESTIWEDVKPENPVETFKKAKQTLENRLTIAKTRAVEKFKVQAAKDGLDEDTAGDQWAKIEDGIETEFQDEMDALESLGAQAQQAIEDNPGLKNTGKRTTKKSTKDKAARRNTFKKALSLIGKLRNEALYFWTQNGCGDVPIAAIDEALMAFQRKIEDKQEADAKAAKKAKFGR